MDDIADVMHLNKALLYHHYSSKSALLYDVFSRAASATKSAVRPERSCSARQDLKQCTESLMRLMADDPSGAAVYFQESPYLDEYFTSEQVREIRSAESAVYESIRAIIERGIVGGDFRDCDSHVLALGYIGMTLGSHRWLTPGSDEHAVRIAAEISQVFVRALDAKEYR